LDAPEAVVQARVAAGGGVARVGRIQGELHAIVGAEREQAQRRVLAHVVLEHRLVVVIDGRDRDAHAAFSQHRTEPGIEPRAPAAQHEARGLGDRAFGEQARVDQVDLEQATELVLLG
jgi:hypothetical protein